MTENRTPDLNPQPLLGQPGGGGVSNGRGDGDQAKAGQSINLDKLRISQDYGAAVGVKRLLRTVPVTKPNKHWFVRTHPDPAYRIETYLLELREERETYLVEPELWAELPGDLTAKVLRTAVTRQGTAFLWPINLPGPDGRSNPWYDSALDAASIAEAHWVRVRADMQVGAYVIDYAEDDELEPTWPEATLGQLIEVAFRHRHIKTMDHPVIRRLRGGV